jgi:hypothetical protein
VQEHFRMLFDDLDEEVVDHFACALVQKYRCFINNATPEKTLTVRGRLYITTAHLAIHIYDDQGAFDNTTFRITVPFADVGRVQKGVKAMMRVITNDASQSSFIFADFETDTHFAAALSLVEQMIEAAIPPAEQEGEDDAGDMETAISKS